MIHITLALGVVVGGILYSIILTVLLRKFSLEGLQAGDLQTARQIAAGGYLMGIALAFYWLEKISLKTRLPTKIPAYPLLVMGVWLTLFRVAIDSITILKLSIAHLLSILSSIIAFESVENILGYISAPINSIFAAFCLIALLIIFLECDPKRNSRNDK